MPSSSSVRCRWLVPGLCLLGLSHACGGPPNSATPSQPSSQVLTVTITTAGVSPKNVDVALGGRVRFVNNDTVTHTIGSDPHPDHTDCPDINQVGFLAPGQSRETGNLVQARVCGYHDHDRPTIEALRGTITIR